MKTETQNGYLLLEVMMTILLLAIGVTGFTALQLKTLRLNLEAQDNSDLSQANAAILDHLRLHPRDAADGDLDTRASTNSSSNAYPSGNSALTQIVESLNAKGINAWIDISCESDGLTVCEICLENVGHLNGGPQITDEENANVKSCNRQIIM